MSRKTAREKLERALTVSFVLPEKANELLDQYREELRKEWAEELELFVRQVERPTEVGCHRHWFVFALNRAADKIKERWDK